MANWALRTSPKFATGVKHQFHQGFFYQIRDPEIPINIYRVLKNNVYNVSGIIEEVKTNMLFILQNFRLCTVLPLDGFTSRCLDFRHNMHRLVLFVLLCLQQSERVITVSTKTCYDKSSKYVSVFYAFSCHSIPAMLKRVYVCTTWRFPFVVLHCTQLIHHRWLSTL